MSALTFGAGLDEAWGAARPKLEAEVNAALERLKQLGEAAAYQAEIIGEHLARVGGRIVRGEVSADTGRVVVQRLIDALELIADGAAEAATAETIRRAKKMLTIALDVAVRIATVALLAAG